MRSLPGRASRSSLAEPAPARTVSHEAQRERIRCAAGELIAKRGYPGVTVELIAKRARVSYKTFYSHYANKEECFCDLFDTSYARAYDRVAAALAEVSQAPWPQRVAVALASFFALIGEEPMLSRGCIVEAPAAGPSMLARYGRATEAFVPLLLEGRAYRSDAARLPESLEETLSGSIIWTTYQRLSVGEADQLGELLPETVELVLRPYLGEAEAAATAAGGPYL